MRKKYILEIYDTIISEIKNPKSINEEEVTIFLKKQKPEIFLIHTIFFIKQNGKISYKINKPIHSLHPNKPEINQNNFEKNTELEIYIPQIEKELKIDDKDKIYRWCSQNEINTLHILVKTEIKELSKENRFFLYCSNLLRNENFRIKKINKERIFEFKTQERIEQYIHKKQYALESLANRLIKEINPKTSNEIYEYTNNYDKLDCLKVTYIYLEKLLRFIEKEYNNYLNVNIQIPYRSILLKEFEVTEKLNYVKSRLLESDINEQLLQLAYEPLLKLSTIKIQEKLTYYEFNYSSEFINELNFQMKLFSEDISENEVENWLFDLNYNTLCFFSYKTKALAKKLEQCTSDIEKMEVLYKLLKTYNQRQTRSFIRYDVKLPSIKEQIINWIEEEIQYLKKKIALESNQFKTILASEDKIKFLTVFSVAQLSYFFGLLVKVGIIKHPNQRDIFRFIADNFKTNNTDTISADSINSKYYNIEAAAKNKVKEKIIELLNLTK